MNAGTRDTTRAPPQKVVFRHFYVGDIFKESMIASYQPFPIDADAPHNA